MSTRILAGLLGALLAMPAAAQTASAVPGTSPTASPPAAAGTTGGLSPQQAARALAVLRDDTKRGEMINLLEAIAKTAPAPPTPGPAPPVVTAAPAGPTAATSTAAVPAAAATATATPAGGAAVVPGTVTAPSTVLAPGTVLGAGTVLAPGTVVSAGTVVAPGAGAAPAAAPAVAGLTAAIPAVKLESPLAPNGLGAQLLSGAAARLRALWQIVVDAARSLTNFTLFVRWVREVAQDPESQTELVDVLWKLAVMTGLTLTTEFGLRRAVRRLRARLLRIAMPAIDPSAAGATLQLRRRHRRARTMLLLRKLPIMLARFSLDAAPVLIAGLISYALLATRLGEPSTTRLVILSLLGAYVACGIATALVAATVSPDVAPLRLIALDDDAAASFVRWVRRLAVVALFGYAITEMLLLLGLYRVAYDTLLKLVALAVHLMLVVLVLQQRRMVAKLIRAPEARRDIISSIRNGIAPIWHFVVIFYLIALWGVWALDVVGGFYLLLRVFVASVAIAYVARLVAVLLVAGIDHVFGAEAPAADRGANASSAMRRYVPALRLIAEGMVGAVAGILMLQAWGLDSLSWFAGDALGGRLLSALLTSLITVAIALALWEMCNAGVQRHLARLTREGQAARSARLRTLLPMLRTALFASIFTVAGLTVLTELGVNTAPLLAGAGVIGLAIGFGSQKLVQDIITGLFLLLENTMQVGDVVTLGGLTGTVENLSIRTIRLRAIDGSVHIVPFSAVTTVTNMTRDFAYALLDISVGLNEEPDHISDLIRDLVDDMRREPRWGAAITDQIEIMGVEKFIDTAWVLRCRLRTVPSQRWTVGRELNRRIKYLFDELAIESPFTSYRVLSAPPPPPPNAKTPEDQAAE